MDSSTPLRSRVRRGPAAVALVAVSLLAASCVDAPAAPEGSGLTFAPFTIQPTLTLVAPRAEVTSAAVADALSKAFDQVNSFRLTVTRASNGSQVLQTTLSVQPGQNEYDLSVEATGVTDGENLLVTIVALQGTTVLFESSPIPVRARTSASSQSTQPVNIPLVYAGPGARATAMSVGPEALLLAPGGSGTMGASVRNADGSEVAGVPISWTVASSSVASVDGNGQVTAAGNGRTRVTASIPTGLTASAWVYVVSGEVAFERGGSVVVRPVAGGAGTDRGAGSMPAWSPDGARLLVDRGGTITDAGSGAGLFEGSSPSVSPDQAKIAAERGGQLVFANPDGSNPTAGPSGATPVWASGSELLVGGGSIQRVRADGAVRTTVVEGPARWPALSGGGQVAWVAGGSLVVDGGAPLLGGVDSRPTWSPDGQWLVASSGGDLHLVPADGSGPPAPMGAEGGSFPAWKPTGGATPSPSGLRLTGLDPEKPAPGAPVNLVGTGFDWIIPANNRAFFPGPDTEVEAEILSVTESALRVRVPNRVAEGTIRVTTFSEQATLKFVPALGSVAVKALTPWGTPVENVRVRLSLASQQVADVRTGADGTVIIPDLADGSYSVAATGPTGFQVVAAPSSLSVTAGVSTALDLVIQPLVQVLTITPENPDMEVGQTIQVTARAIDINGNPIEQFTDATWFGLSSALSAAGNGLTGSLSGVHPVGAEGGAGFRLILNGQPFDLHATVRSKITGIVRKRAASSVSSASAQSANLAAADAPTRATVHLLKGSQVVSSASSGSDGRYTFSGLLAGTYVVQVANLDEGYTSDPVTVELGAANPTGQADLLIRPTPPPASGDLIAVNDWNIWDSFTNPPALIQTLVSTANNSGTKVVWWCGRHGARSGSAIQSICSSSITSTGGGQFSGTRDAITAAGWGFEVDYQTPLTSIPDDVRVFWMWTPTDPLTNAEVNVLKQFAARGGRIIFNADFYEAWYYSTLHANVATQLYSQLGTGITSVGTLISNYTGVLADPSHPIAQALAAQDVTTVKFAAPGNFTVVPPGVALIINSGEITVAYAPVDTTPLPLVSSSTSSAVRSWTPPTATVTVTPPCRPGLSCDASKR